MFLSEPSQGLSLWWTHSLQLLDFKTWLSYRKDLRHTVPFIIANATLNSHCSGPVCSRSAIWTCGQHTCSVGTSSQPHPHGPLGCYLFLDVVDHQAPSASLRADGAWDCLIQEPRTGRCSEIRRGRTCPWCPQLTLNP